MKKYPKYITVSDLIRHLKNFPKNIIVGTIGYYGEINEIDTYNFSIRRGHKVPINKSWREKDEDTVDVLNITIPDIGTDPDSEP